MVSVLDRAQRILESREKILSPYELDDSLCLYSPQDNVEALDHPRIRDWMSYILERYQPETPPARERVLLLLPCTKTKPYPASLEHLRINQALLDAGFRPTKPSHPSRDPNGDPGPSFSSEVINLSPLANSLGTVIHRAVVSEPLAFVPYENILFYEDKKSPATAYDDPGLFENRGNAVSPWRKDFSGVAISKTRWAWGEAERRAYVIMHNEMARILAAVLARLSAHFTKRIAWVAPGLTHRSFIIARGERRAHNVASGKRVGKETLRLTGANDHLPSSERVLALPTVAQCEEARRRLAERLGVDARRVGGAYSRGGGGATPLALPELLESLVAALRT
jgi:hypothetical protein